MNKQEMVKLLFAAVKSGDTSKVNELLENGFDVNMTTPSGRTALMVAAQTNNVEMTSFLLSKGANRKMRTKTNMTAALWAKNETRKLFPW